MKLNGTTKMIVGALVALIFTSLQGLSFFVLRTIREDVKEVVADQKECKKEMKDMSVTLAGIVARHDLEDRLKGVLKP